MIFSKLGTFAITHRFVKVTATSVRFYVNYGKFKPLVMPKDMKAYLKDLQKQRLRIKAQSIKYTPTFAYLQVVGHGTRSESRSVFLCTDHWNYLFNCGEGTQRLACEFHAKLTKIEHVFITRPTWDNIGGLPGVALTVQETGVPNFYLHGPEDSIGVIEATQNFMTLNNLTVKQMDISKTFRDQTMAVNYILIQKPRNSAESNEEEDQDVIIGNINFYAYENNENNRKRPRSPTEKSEKKVLKKKSNTDDLVVFICKLEKKLGSLNMQKCTQLGIPSGPLLGRLKMGEDVTLEDGRIIKSADVVGKSDGGPTFIVLDCPGEDWIDLIIENPAFAKYQNSEEGEKITCIVHFAEENILNNPKYKEWMQKFGSETTHMIINQNNTGYSGESMHKMQHQLHLIHPTIFPFLQDKQKFVDPESLPKINSDLDDEKKVEEMMSQNISLNKSNNETTNLKDLDTNFLTEGLKVRRCKTLDVFNLRPHTGVLKTDKNVKINPNAYIQEAMEVDGFLDSLADLQTEINRKTKALGDNLEEYPKILMLGTGSSIPNKVRNTSAILLQVDEERSMLLDCAEGTVNQIIRFHGETKAEEVFKSIKAVYISHLHADHHLGLIGLLEHRRKFTDEPIFLLAPQQMMPYLRYYDSRFNRILQNFQLISNRNLMLNKTILTPTQQKSMLEALNISNINTEFVTHCPFAYGVAITLKDNRKICYSGDSMPCENLTKLARDSFLLIHEATMEDALEAEALKKRHSTISQAINTGVKANVNFTLLTHFSQRYCKLPLLPDSEQSGNDYSNVGIAYDFMSISLSKLSLLPLLYKTLSVLFSDFRTELYQKAIKRDYQKMREKN